jgi:hypothetical protein
MCNGLSQERLEGIGKVQGGMCIRPEKGWAYVKQGVVDSLHQS